MVEDTKQLNSGIDNEKNGKILWHDAFYEALQIELNDYAYALSFEHEHKLSKEALSMDVLIIKKSPDVKILKNIGRIFKEHNIFEYLTLTGSWLRTI